MLKELLKDFNLSDDKIEKLNRLREICLEYNKHTNLTSITDVNEFNIKHILDSISIIDFYELENSTLLDVGSGGGFPGLVLAIVVDGIEVTMIDSNNKKTKYIDHAINELGINNAKSINSRIEEADLEEKFDFVTARAVAALNILVEITASSIKVGGKGIYYKGSNLDEEIPSNWNVISVLGLELDKENTFKLDEQTDRKLISFNKVKKTGEGHPRDYAQIKRNPIF